MVGTLEVSYSADRSTYSLVKQYGRGFGSMYQKPWKNIYIFIYKIFKFLFIKYLYLYNTINIPTKIYI